MVIRHPTCKRQGFTLLEVMVSVTIISIALVTLIGSQSRSVSIATFSRFDTTASLLARQKMTELTLAGFDDLRSAEGDFGDDFPGFGWKTEVMDLGEDDTGIKGIPDMLRSVELTVFSVPEGGDSFVLREILMAPIAAEEEK